MRTDLLECGFNRAVCPLGSTGASGIPVSSATVHKNRLRVGRIRLHRISRRLFQLILRGNPGRYGHTTRPVTQAFAVAVTQIRAAYFNSPASGSGHCRGLEQRTPKLPVTIAPRFLPGNFDHLRRLAFI